MAQKTHPKITIRWLQQRTRNGGRLTAEEFYALVPAVETTLKWAGGIKHQNELLSLGGTTTHSGTGFKTVGEMPEHWILRNGKTMLIRQWLVREPARMAAVWQDYMKTWRFTFAYL